MIAELIDGAGSVACFVHKNPDGDAIGSALAIRNFFGGKVRVYSPTKVPEFFMFLPAAHEIVCYSDFGEVEPAELFLVVDCADAKRIPGFDRSKADRVIVIDHHETNDGFGDVNLVVPESSSTAELVFRMIKSLGRPVSKEVADCLFTGVYTDTGGFRYSDTTASTFEVAKELVELGAEPWRIAVEIYESNPLRRLRLLGECLNTLRLYCSGKVAVLYVTLDMYARTGATAEDTEDFVNYARSIKGVEVGLFLRELEGGGVKVSLRSKGRVNVAEVAKELGGGGHHNAAGCELNLPLVDAIDRIVSSLERRLLEDGHVCGAGG